MWDCAITLLSLALAAWFILFEPQLRRWHEFCAARREREEERQLPPPRYAPLDQADEGENQRQGVDWLLKGIANFGEPVHEPGTGTAAVPSVPAGTPDTNNKNERYHQVCELVRSGYSGNQICELMGGKRADTLALVRRAREENLGGNR